MSFSPVGRQHRRQRGALRRRTGRDAQCLFGRVSFAVGCVVEGAPEELGVVQFNRGQPVMEVDSRSSAGMPLAIALADLETLAIQVGAGISYEARAAFPVVATRLLLEQQKLRRQ